MSSILDALRKLEKEKTERGEVLSTAVAGDILRVDYCRRRRRWLLPTVLMVIVLLVVVAALLLHKSTVPIRLSSEGAVPPPAPLSTVASALNTSANVATSQPSDLPVLSGIVYQQQREARIAILNDLPTMEGADVAGYRLQEILPDRVVLLQGGHRFEVLFLDAVGTP